MNFSISRENSNLIQFYIIVKKFIQKVTNYLTNKIIAHILIPLNANQNEVSLISPFCAVSFALEIEIEID